jgi:type IV pilus assembly protein PilN
MYNIDINFLKDRKLDTLTSSTAFRKKSQASFQEKLPIVIGSGVGVALIGIAGGALLLFNNQKATRTQEIAEIEAEIARLQGKNAEVQQIQTKINTIKQEISVLASVFEEIKPWSAMLAEIASVVPPNVQISSLAQSGKSDLTISGVADSYKTVNDLYLTLKKSPLLDKEKTVMGATSLTGHPNQILFDSSEIEGEQASTNAKATEAKKEEITLPQVATFSMTTAITDESSQKYLNQLNRQGAIGLVSRLTALQRKGVLDITTEDITTNEGETQP